MLCFLICLCACWLIYILVYFSCVVFPHLFMCVLADLRTGLFLMCCVSSFVHVRVGCFTYWFISHVLCFLICLCACWLIHILVFFSCVVFPHLFMCMLADSHTGLSLVCCFFLICLCACWLIYILVYFSCVAFPHLFMCMLADLHTGLFLMCCVSSFVYVHVG